MEVIFADIISVISLLLGGGGLGYFFSWRYNRRKEKAEVEQAETTAAKEMKDMYQQLIEDVKRDRDEQKAYIVEQSDLPLWHPHNNKRGKQHFPLHFSPTY